MRSAILILIISVFFLSLGSIFYQLFIKPEPEDTDYYYATGPLYSPGANPEGLLNCTCDSHGNMLTTCGYPDEKCEYIMVEETLTANNCESFIAQRCIRRHDDMETQVLCYLYDSPICDQLVAEEYERQEREAPFIVGAQFFCDQNNGYFSRGYMIVAPCTGKVKGCTVDKETNTAYCTL